MSTIQAPDVVRDAEPIMSFYFQPTFDEAADDYAEDGIEYDVYADGDGGYWVGWCIDSVGLVTWDHARNAGAAMMLIPDNADRTDDNPLNILP